MNTQRRAVQCSAGGGGGGVSSLHAIAPNHNGWTEAEIRRWLDGTFTKMEWERNRAITIFVDADHIPKHVDVRGEIRGDHEKWIPEEDAKLIELVREGVTRKQDLAVEMERSEESVASRLRRLRRAGCV